MDGIARPVLVYEKVADYHVALRKGDPPRVSRRGKSRCHASIDLALAQRMLGAGYRHDPPVGTVPRAVFARFDGLWYRATQHGGGKYHGAPVDECKVPVQARRGRERYTC